jgi:hypothetical protein
MRREEEQARIERDGDEMEEFQRELRHRLRRNLRRQNGEEDTDEEGSEEEVALRGRRGAGEGEGEAGDDMEASLSEEELPGSSNSDSSDLALGFVLREIPFQDSSTSSSDSD